ncbi:vascular cell adhesion protein 1 [Pagrus major]|uniref:vascular cell adhesion protein 1 n=1 Tax=Pagrus major TaxID=143350 RepID=UPI003CC85E42
MLPLRMLGLLMLMILLCDADGSCPNDINPVNLHPPEVIGEYNGTVFLNCSSSEEYHDGLYLELGNTTHHVGDDKGFVSGLLSLSDWNATAKCRVKLNKTLECSKDFGITIYKTPDRVSLSVVGDGPMVEGTKRLLGCDIINVAHVQNLTVIWYRDNETIHTETFTETSVTPINVTSIFTINVKRHHNGAVFRCKAELHLGPEVPQQVYESPPYPAEVHYAPEFVFKPAYALVEEGGNVTLTCEARGNPPPVFTWTSNGVNIMASTRDLTITQVTISTTYRCTAANHLGKKTKQIYVRVIPRINPPTNKPEAPAERDADASCPDDINPVTLHPPEVIGEYNGTVFLNCSSSEEHHDRLYLELGNTIHHVGDNESFVSGLLSLSDWNVTAKCRVKLNETLECSKDFGITIYKTPDRVSLSVVGDGPMVEGTERLLGCDIINVAPVQNLTVIWYRDNETIHTETFTETSVTPISVTSIFTINVERHHNGAVFRCEAELHLGPEVPQQVDKSPPYPAEVHYAPEFFLKPVVVTVEEGGNVTLTCEARGNPPPVFTWTSTGVNIRTNTRDLTITQVTTNTTYRCTAANHLGATTQNFDVRVTSRINSAPMNSPEAPAERGCPLILMPAEVVVRFGDPVSVNCSIASNTDFSGMGWEAAFGGTGYEKKSSLTWTVKKLEAWDIKPQCYMTPKNGTQCFMTPDVTVYKTPDNVSVSAMNDGQMVEGKEYLLVCNIINVAPVQNLKVIWYRDNENIHTETFNKTTVTPVNESSSLRVTVDRHHNGAVFKCKAELHLGPHGPEPIPTTTSLPYTAVVYYKPLIEGCPSTYTAVEGKFSLDTLPCQADGNPRPTTQWSYQGEKIKADELLNRKHSGEYTAVAESSSGSSSISINITIEYSPSFACNDRYEVKEGVNSQTPCEPEGLPRPVITWLKDGKEIPTPQHWTKHDSGNYSLKATNEHGTATHTLYLDVLYAPVFKEGDHLREVKEVISGENVTLSCSAEGKPAPDIRWIYDPMPNVDQTETTGRRQRNVTITGATSTNAGVYHCVATNDVGTVTRDVTLVVKDKSRGIPQVVIWVLLILLFISIIVIIILVVHSRQKKHGQYNFIPSRATDGSDIPMTPKSNGVKA